VKIVYNGVPVDGPPPMLTGDYIEGAKAAVLEQLKREGVRLAALLCRALK
jgi:hypothetical protein